MNVLLVSIDTLRADHLSCYGYPRLTSPHLDRLAGEGVRFAEAYSPHIPTHPAYTTLLTGKDAWSHQIVAQASPRTLDPKHRLLPELLQEQGYFTASVDNLGRWLSRGFELWERYDWEKPPDKPWRKAEAVNAKALPVLEQCARQSKPFFAFFHYWDPHSPYLPPPPFDRMFYHGDETAGEDPRMEQVLASEQLGEYFRQWMGPVRDAEFPVAQYDAEIAYLDTALAHLFTAVEALGLREKTALVIQADHGEEHVEHGCWFDHHGLYETNIHIPLILRCPGRLPAGRVVRGFVRQQDLAPTILDLLGIGDLASREQMDGLSLLPLLGGRGRRGACRELYLTESTWMRKRGVRTGRWKLIEALEPDIHDKPPLELYDLANDPGETRNLAEEMRDQAAALRRKLHRYSRKRQRETGNPDPTETSEITLRKIGALPAAVPADLKGEGGE
jgi:arylsulfatase A-like enzyme